MNFNTLLKESCHIHSEKTFLQFEEQIYTYQEMWDITSRIASGFSDAGIKKGDHVAIILPNQPEFIFCWFALSKLGVVAVTIDTRLSGDLLFHQLQNSECKAIITDNQLLSVVNELEGLAIDTVFLVDSKGNSITPSFSMKTKIISYHELSTSSPINDSAIFYELEHGWPLSVVYTSGTTGPAKGVVNPHETFILSGKDIGEAVAMSENDRLYIFLPLFHANPQLMGIPALVTNGATLVLGRKFSASKFWDIVNHYGVTIFTYVGTVLSILDKVTEPGVNHSLRAAYGGGAPGKVWVSLEEKTGINIIEGYGMAEIGGFAVMNSNDNIVRGSVGKVRDVYDITIVSENDQEVPPETIGEIVVRPNVPFSMFSGYQNMPKETVAAMKNLWFHTGDLAKRDQQGNFYFIGRKKNMIRKNGENISGYEIENIVQQCPEILESAVVPVHDEIAGEEIKLSIVCKPDQQITYEALSHWLEQHLPSHMVPRYIDIRKAFEKTSSEKIKIQALIDEGTATIYDRKNKNIEV